jgi:hypothetical protein
MRIFLCGLAVSLAACSGSDEPLAIDGTSEDDGGGGGGGGTGNTDGGRPMPADAGDGKPLTSTPLVDKLEIREIALFQTVKIGLMKDGAPVTGTVPPVVDRAGLLRVYVAPQAGYAPHAIQAQLTLQTGGVETVIPVDATPAAASTDASLASTINFPIATGVLKADTTFSVALREKTGTGAGGNGRWPSGTGLAKLNAVSTGPQLKVVLVPLAYAADGSNRLPDTSAAQVQIYQQRLAALYPAAKVDMTVRAAVTIAFAVSRNGGGFGNMLNTVLQTRAQDNPSRDTYYYGLASPAASFSAFCGGACVAGLSRLVTNASDASSRGSVGLGFTGANSAGTMAHEIGHAHGRDHAPCGGAGGADPRYPYRDGSIGVWGYDQGLNKLLDPAQYKDMMGYCEPDWISDYQYGALITRMRAVSGASIRAGVPMQYQFGGFDPNGSVTWNGAAPLETVPGGEAREIEYFDASGRRMLSQTGYLYAYDHLPGGSIVAPAVPGAVRARLVQRFPTTVHAPLLTPAAR